MSLCAEGLSEPVWRVSGILVSKSETEREDAPPVDLCENSGDAVIRVGCAGLHQCVLPLWIRAHMHIHRCL